MPQYNYQTGQMEETEEERQRREAANTPVKQTLVTNPDGSQEMTIKGTPEALSPVNPNTPTVVQPSFGDRLGQAVSQFGTNLVNNVQAAPERFVNNLNRGVENLQQAPANFARNVAAIPDRVQQAVAPVAPDQAAYTRQQESGGNPNIGYHYQPDAQGQRKSSAYGPYGFTTAAVQDIARQDPSLNKPITEWTQQDHDRGYAIKTQQNGQRMKQLGVEATPGALQVAHLLGADGAARFLQTGEVSAQAAAANGGVERLKQIAAGRYAGAQAPASGAAQAQRPPAMGPVTPEQAQQQDQQFAQQRQQYQAAPNSYDEFGTPVFSQAQANLDTQINRYQSIQDKPDELLKFAFDDTAPDFLKQRAKDQIVEQYAQQKNKAQAEAAIPKMNQNDVARAISKKSEGNSVGDWVQYLLFRHVGLTDLANQKGEQLGIGHKWTQSTITDDAGNDIGVELQTTASGKILGGNRMDGTPLTAKELNIAGASIGSKLNLVGGTFVNDKTGEVGRVVSDEKTGRTYVQTDKGRRPMEGFRPQSSTGTAADQRSKLIQEMNIKLQGKTLEEQMAIQRDYNKLLVGQGLAPMQPGETPLTAPQIAGGAPAGVTTAVPGAPAGGAPRPTAGGAPAATGATTPAAPAVPGAPRPTASQIAATAEQQKQEAQEVGVDLGKVRTNFGKSKDAATRLINQAEELITDPGFSVSVGASAQPFFQYIPGSDRATWKAKHEEVVGQTFLTAIESLKGMGALSDKEGAAATAAISRLKNTDQNEESFKAAVKELQFIVKRGVDRNAEKLGKEKPFGTSEPEVGASDLSPQARAAAELERRKKEKR